LEAIIEESSSPTAVATSTPKLPVAQVPHLSSPPMGMEQQLSSFDYDIDDMDDMDTSETDEVIFGGKHSEYFKLV